MSEHSQSRHSSAFTLVELLVVIGIIAIMMAILVPAMNPLKKAGDLTKAAQDIAGTIEQARAYAMARNTYVWVGFYEEDVTAAGPTVAQPPYPGKGRVVIATVASKDGTTIVDDNATGSVPLNAAKFTQVGRLLTVENAHLMDIGTPVGGDSQSLDGRSGLPYDNTIQGPVTAQNRISSDNTEKTSRPFTAQNYTFWKTIRFSPRGEANLNSTYKLRRVAEIGVVPTHGSVVDTASPNVTAIQFTGVAGNVKIFRK